MTEDERDAQAKAIADDLAHHHDEMRAMLNSVADLLSDSPRDLQPLSLHLVVMVRRKNQTPPQTSAVHITQITEQGAIPATIKSYLDSVMRGVGVLLTRLMLISKACTRVPTEQEFEQITSDASNIDFREERGVAKVALDDCVEEVLRRFNPKKGWMN